MALTKAKLREQIQHGDYDDVLPGGGSGITETEVNALISAAIAAARLAENPVGTILSNVTGTNPGTYIGGTWVAWGSGRVPVGVDAAQTEFNTVEKTGGSKTHALAVSEMPSHRHDMQRTGSTASPGYTSVFSSASAGETTGSLVGYNGGGGAHNNLQPFITCYMWKRTA